MLKLIEENIPAELQPFPQWVCWKAKTGKNGKIDKIPFDPKTGRAASSADPTTWGLFEQAVATSKNGGGYAGIGFVLNGGPFVGVDLDYCRNLETGDIQAWAWEIVRKLNTYTEISPSGKGLRMFLKGELKNPGRRKGKIECYNTGRFLTVTGHRVKGTPAAVMDRQNELNAFHREYIAKPKQKRKPPSGQSINIEDNELLERARKAKNGDAFEKLFSGDWTGYPSQSEADQAFCNMLAFWTGRNAEQMERIFRQSGLYREKCNKHPTYLVGTIQKAIDDCTEVYTGKGCYFNADGTFIPAWLARDIMRKYHIKYAADDLWIYDGGVYRPGGEPILARIAQEKLGDATRTNRIRETIDYIKRATYTELPKPDKNNINLKNGILDWRTGTLHPHNPEIFNIVQLPVNYDPKATCPVFDKYLGTTLDRDAAALALEIMGYCLIPDTKYEKAVMLTGQGRNGKSIFLHVLENLLGRENVSNVALQELEENRFKAAELMGKLANIFADLDSRALTSTTFLKMLTSGDPIQAERKFKDPFSFTNYARLIFSANTLPRSADTTFAFYERWLIIPFTRTFDKNNPATDPNLRDKLTRPEELSGILNKALKALQFLEIMGCFTEPASVKAAKKDYQVQNDSVLAFCEEHVEVDPSGFLTKQNFYSEYTNWCIEQGLKPVSQKTLKPRLLQAFPHVVDDRIERGGPRGWIGIKLVNLSRPLM